MKLTNRIALKLSRWCDKKLNQHVEEIYQHKLMELFELFKGKNLVEILWEMVFTYEFSEPIDLKERYKVYARMNSDDGIIKLLRGKYSKNYQAYFNARNDEERNILKGRMAEIMDIFNSMSVASDRLAEWDKTSKVRENTVKLRKDLNNLLLNN
jgi:inorganic triphosphatase YgiF